MKTTHEDVFWFHVFRAMHDPVVLLSWSSYYNRCGGEGGGQCHVDVTYRDDFISKGESQTRNCCPSETRPMLGGKHPGECRCVCNGC